MRHVYIAAGLTGGLLLVALATLRCCRKTVADQERLIEWIDETSVRVLPDPAALRLAKLAHPSGGRP